MRQKLRTIKLNPTQILDMRMALQSHYAMWEAERKKHQYGTQQYETFTRLMNGCLDLIQEKLSY